MKSAVVLLLSMAAVSCAQDRKMEDRSQQAAGEKKRLESVTWDLKSHKLIWVIQKGSEHEGKFVPETSDKYEISPDDAVMAFSDEKRGFTREEAASLHKLLDTLSLYCAESVIWWDQGEGTPLDGTPAKPGQKRKAEPDNKPQRVEQDDQMPKRADPTLLVAGRYLGPF